MILHPIYPSSKVDPVEIVAYGWEQIESIPTIVNKQGRLAPTPERSALHFVLREQIEKEGTTTYFDMISQPIEIKDFAIAEHRTIPETLGFFALM
jgi:hypothetical protein